MAPGFRILGFLALFGVAGCTSTLTIGDQSANVQTTIAATTGQVDDTTESTSSPDASTNDEGDTTGDAQEESTTSVTTPEETTTTIPESTTTIEPLQEGENSELIYALEELRSQYGSSRLIGPYDTGRCGIRAAVLVGPTDWGPLESSADPRIPESMFFSFDGAWTRTDHVSLDATTVDGIAAFAFSNVRFIEVDGYDELLLLRDESSADGTRTVVKKLDSTCRWWDRPVITMCGVADSVASMSGNGSMIMHRYPLDSDPLPCEPASAPAARWNSEFQMIEPAVSGADWCNDFVDDSSRELPLTPCMQGATVSAVQQGLAESGYTMDVDGYFGPGTMRTIMRFEQSTGMTVTGQITTALITALGI